MKIKIRSDRLLKIKDNKLIIINRDNKSLFNNQSLIKKIIL